MALILSVRARELVKVGLFEDKERVKFIAFVCLLWCLERQQHLRRQSHQPPRLT